MLRAFLCSRMASHCLRGVVSVSDVNEGSLHTWDIFPSLDAEMGSDSLDLFFFTHHLFFHWHL